MISEAEHKRWRRDGRRAIKWTIIICVLFLFFCFVQAHRASKRMKITQASAAAVGRHVRTETPPPHYVIDLVNPETEWMRRMRELNPDAPFRTSYPGIPTAEDMTRCIKELEGDWDVRRIEKAAANDKRFKINLHMIDSPPPIQVKAGAVVDNTDKEFIDRNEYVGNVMVRGSVEDLRGESGIIEPNDLKERLEEAISCGLASVRAEKYHVDLAYFMPCVRTVMHSWTSPFRPLKEEKRMELMVRLALFREK